MTHLFHKRLFFPVFCLVSAIFIPLFVLSLLAIILVESSVGYICITTLFLVYIGIVISIKFGISKNKDCFTVTQDAICFNHYHKGESTRTLIPFSQIIQVDYYRMGSIISWFLCLHSFVLPRCVFVTYTETTGEEKTVLLGYILKKDAESLFHDWNFVLH